MQLIHLIPEKTKMDQQALTKAAAQHLQRLKPGCSVIIHGHTYWTDEDIRNAFESGAAWSDGNNFVEKSLKKAGSYVGDGNTTHGVRHIRVPESGIDLFLDTTKSHIIFYKSVAMLEFLCIELGKEKRALSVSQDLIDFNAGVIKYLLVPSNDYTGWRTKLTQHECDVHFAYQIQTDSPEYYQGVRRITYLDKEATNEAQTVVSSKADVGSDALPEVSLGMGHERPGPTGVSQHNGRDIPAFLYRQRPADDSTED